MPEPTLPDRTLSEQAVVWEQPEEGILRILLQHPPANALGLPIITGLQRALQAADRLDARVIVIASSVPGFFAAGADIKHMASIDREGFASYARALAEPMSRLASAERVSLAAIDGLALGGGLELAMACTLRLAGAGSRLGLPEVELGLIPGAGGTQRLPRLVGRGLALDMILTGRQIDAAEARASGLVDRLAAAGEAELEALTLAGRLARLSRPALRAVIETVGAADELPLGEGLVREVETIRRLFETPEAREGLAAFVEKRPPRFG